MYLKSLEMQGFKSFPDKTKLTFEGGSTVIVGPNGSGKSNISDAMRWVLGEVSSKSIRGAKMEDIIFGGADSRKPMGYAEVSVTFDNTGMFGRLDCPYDEVTVTRRYYRAGESEYYINRRAVRLRDIYELFMNTGIGRDGYSIIGQGKIAEIISKKGDERRSIFEDASGIAKYRLKKSDTERKLKATEDNMTRINDVFAEVEAQVGPLEKEAEKAKKAIDLLETKKKVDVQLWLYDTEKIRADLNKTEEDFKRAEFELQTAEDSIKAYEVQNDRLFEASQSNKQASEKLLSEIRAQTNENHALDSEYQVTSTNIIHTKEMIAENEGNIASISHSVDNERNAIENRRSNIDKLTSELEAKNSEHDALSSATKACEERAAALESDIAVALEDIRVLEAEAVDIKVRMSVLENARDTGSDRNAAILTEISGYEATSKSLSEQMDRAKASVDDYQSSIDETDAETEKLSLELEKLYDRQNSENDALSADKLRRESVVQRLETFKHMEEQFEGYSGSVRFVMNQYAEGKIRDRAGLPCGKIYGPLSKVISVEDKFVTAIETALGANLQNIVVEDEEVAKAAMFALRKAEAGRATFVPLTSMRAQKATQEMRDASGYAGYIAVADELVGSDAKFRDVLSGLLGRTLIFDNIDNATVMAKALGYKVRAVTLDGQQINVGGSFTGGSVKQKGNILGRAGEIKRLDADAKELSARIDKATAALNELLGEIEALEDDVASLVEKKKLLLVMQGSEASRLEQLGAKRDANESLIAKLKSDFEELAEMKARYEEDIESFSAREAELKARISEISAVRVNKDIARSQELDQKSEIDERMTALFIEISRISKDIETENAMIGVSEAHISEFCEQQQSLKARLNELLLRISEYESAQKQNRERYAEGEKALAALNDNRAKLEEGGVEFERKLNEVNAKMREKMSQKELIFRDYSKLENKLANQRAEQDKLATKLWDEYELTRAEAVALGYPVIDATTRAEAAHYLYQVCA